MSFYVKYPAAGGGDVTLNGAQTLTNKTLSGNTATYFINGSAAIALPTISGTLATLGGAGVFLNKSISGLDNTITNVSLSTGVTGVLSVGLGGTGANNAISATKNLLPDQTTNLNKFLSTDGTNVLWMSIPADQNKANLTLSNLASPTAINVDLTAAVDGAYNLGSPSVFWGSLYVHIISAGPTSTILIDALTLNLNNNTIINLANPVNPKDAATKAYVDASIPPVGANRTLSNLLAPTAINQALLPDFDVNQNLGSFSNRWGNIYGLGIAYLGKVTLIDASNAPKGSFLARSKIVDGISYTGPEITAGGSTYVDVALSTNPDGGTDAIPTGSAIIFTGDKQGGTGNSGNIKLYTGTSIGGARGKIILSGSSVDVNSRKINLNTVLNLTVQTAPTTPVNGDLWFDGTNLKFVVGGVTKTITMI